jgi:hypothetical protein
MKANEPPTPGDLRPEGGSAFDQYAMEGRIEARMLHADKPITDEQQTALIRELLSYRDSHGTPNGRPMAWAALGGKIGVSGSVLIEIVHDKYKASPEHALRKIDQFLADERIKLGRFDTRSFTRIEVTDKIAGVIAQGLKHNTIPVIIGQPGSGKTSHARWFVGSREGAILIEADDLDNDYRWVIDAVYKALGLLGRKHRYRRDKKRAIVDYLRKHKNTVIVVDESQKLDRSGLEMLRRLHDLSDPQGLRNISIVLFGDRDFYKLIINTRGGSRTPISPQITRRMYPIFQIDVDGCQGRDEAGNPVPGTVFSQADIEATIKNKRLRVLRPEGVAWMAKLANVDEFGSFGLAMRVFEVAWDHRRSRLVGLQDLALALSTVLGPDEAELVDEQAGHELLVTTVAAG